MRKNHINLYRAFDHLGLITFSYLLIDALVYLKGGNKDLRTYIQLLIGAGGLLIDGYLVFFYKENK